MKNDLVERVENSGPVKKRFKVFILDSGWDSPAHRVLEKSMDLFTRQLSRHDVFILDRAQSDKFLETHPFLIGMDPIIALLDPEKISRWTHHEYGARFMLGHVKSEARVQMLLKMLLRLVNTERMAEHLPVTIRQIVHKEGVRGAWDIILETATHIESELPHPSFNPEV
jgi:hypothetical protein